MFLCHNSINLGKPPELRPPLYNGHNLIPAIEGFHCSRSVSITKQTTTYLVYTLKTVSLDFLWHFKCMICVDFAENALFSSFDVCSFRAPWQVFDGQNEQQ
jgi:hypothetical protein